MNYFRFDTNKAYTRPSEDFSIDQIKKEIKKTSFFINYDNVSGIASFFDYKANLLASPRQEAINEWNSSDASNIKLVRETSKFGFKTSTKPQITKFVVSDYDTDITNIVGYDKGLKDSFLCKSGSYLIFIKEALYVNLPETKNTNRLLFMEAIPESIMTFFINDMELVSNMCNDNLDNQHVMSMNPAMRIYDKVLKYTKTLTWNVDTDDIYLSDYSMSLMNVEDSKGILTPYHRGICGNKFSPSQLYAPLNFFSFGEDWRNEGVYTESNILYRFCDIKELMTNHERRSSDASTMRPFIAFCRAIVRKKTTDNINAECLEIQDQRIRMSEENKRFWSYRNTIGEYLDNNSNAMVSVKKVLDSTNIPYEKYSIRSAQNVIACHNATNIYVLIKSLFQLTKIVAKLKQSTIFNKDFIDYIGTDNSPNDIRIDTLIDKFPQHLGYINTLDTNSRSMEKDKIKNLIIIINQKISIYGRFFIEFYCEYYQNNENVSNIISESLYHVKTS